MRQEVHERAVELWWRGYTTREIADRCHVNKDTVLGLLVAAGKTATSFVSSSTRYADWPADKKRELERHLRIYSMARAAASARLARRRTREESARRRKRR